MVSAASVGPMSMRDLRSGRRERTTCVNPFTPASDRREGPITEDPRSADGDLQASVADPGAELDTAARLEQGRIVERFRVAFVEQIMTDQGQFDILDPPGQTSVQFDIGRYL